MKNLALFLPLLLFSTGIIAQAPSENPAEMIAIGDKHIIDSKILGEQREILIHVPSDFYGMNETNMRYPIVVVMDGESQFISTVGVLDQLNSAASANDLCPAMIIVGIPNTNRDRDLTPTPGVVGSDSSSLSYTGGADKLAQFLEKELIPCIDKTYPTAPHRTLIGHSLGGLFALNTLIKFPHLFTNYLAIDPFMSWDDQRFSRYVIEQLSENRFEGKNLYIATANTRMSWMDLNDVRSDTSEIMKVMRSVIEFGDELKKNKLAISFQNKLYENENHFQIPLIATYDGLRYFYQDYPFRKMVEYYHPDPPIAHANLTNELEAHFKKLSNQMGYTVRPMESYLNAWAFGFLQWKKPKFAEQLFNLNTEYYPGSANVWAAKAHYFLTQNDTVQAIRSLEKSLAIKEVTYVREQLEALQK
ncbi:MAG: alpha/beta hydrolase [Calditrichia bacterium]